jgi:uncharacterized membrane protein
MFFNPLTFLFMIIFLFFLVIFFVIVQINIIAFAFTEIGVPSQYIFLALLAILLGSFINIPVKKIPQKTITDKAWVSYFGFRHVIPAWQRQETVLAVNLGGAVIPTVLTIYLLFKTGLWGTALIPTLLMIVLTYRLAKPMPRVGIALPAFVPPVFAAILSVILAYGHAPLIAYISGTLGTLIGADLLNIRKIEALGAPVVSIGGAGTFDGIFLNGLIAVLLAAILT